MVQDNVASAFARNPPRMWDIDGFGKGTGPAALVCGGPSLRDTMQELREFKGTVFSCGSVHDYLIENGIVPHYHVQVDPDLCDGDCRFLTRPHPDVTYLLASQCNPQFFDKLADYRVHLWHAHVVGLNGEKIIDFRGERTIPGGDYAVLRAWPIAGVMGYREIEFFGFDLSFPKEDEAGQHAYPYNWEVEEPVLVTTREGLGNSFFTTPGWMAQLQVFVRMLMLSAGQFKVTIHGDGLVADVCCGGADRAAA